MNIAEAVQSVLDRLTAGGLRAVNDERDINPPCVFIGPPGLDWRFGRGDFTASFTAWAVTAASGRNIDLVNLAELLEAAGTALDWAGVHAEPADLLVPNQAAPLPAYRVTWTESFRH